MLRDRKLIYRVISAIWFVIGILSTTRGTYRIALVMFFLAVVFFLLPNWMDGESGSESPGENQD